MSLGAGGLTFWIRTGDVGVRGWAEVAVGDLGGGGARVGRAKVEPSGTRLNGLGRLFLKGDVGLLLGAAGRGGDAGGPRMDELGPAGRAGRGARAGRLAVCSSPRSTLAGPGAET